MLFQNNMDFSDNLFFRKSTTKKQARWFQWSEIRHCLFARFPNIFAGPILFVICLCYWRFCCNLLAITSILLALLLVLLAFRYFLCYTPFIGGLPCFVRGVFNFISNLVQFISDFLDSIGDLLFWLIRLARSFYFANML